MLTDIMPVSCRLTMLAVVVYAVWVSEIRDGVGEHARPDGWSEGHGFRRVDQMLEYAG